MSQSQSTDLPFLCRDYHGCKVCREVSPRGDRKRAEFAAGMLASFNLSGAYDCPFGRGAVGTIVEKPPKRGFGDTIASITGPVLAAVGLEPCGGCEQRRALANALLPYKSADLPPTGE